MCHNNLKQVISPIFIVTILFFFSCKSKEKISANVSTANDTILLASIERTPCFGRCATYKISIYQSGYVVYEGKKYVKNIGIFFSRIDKTKVEEIKNYIIKNNLLELEDKYIQQHIADFPSTYTEANLNGKYKRTVETDPRAPKQLKDYQTFLDSFFTDETVWTPLKKIIKEPE